MRTEIRERVRRSRDWLLAIDELEQEAEGVESAEERSELLFEIANLTEEVVPERDRALAIYQRAWKLHPENVKALTRARQVYRELGRLEMVAKVGELELKLRQNDGALAAVVGEALLDSGQPAKALPILQIALEASPDDTRIKDALAAASYDSETWIDDIDRLTSEAERADSVTAARMLLRAARIVHIETPDDGQYEALLEQALVNDPQNESANYLYESLLSRKERWSDLEAHHGRRIYAAADETDSSELARRFALEWVQRFRDRERAAKFFAQSIELAGQNGETSLSSMVAAFSLFREIFGGRSEWEQILDLADRVLDRIDGDQRLFVAQQSGLIAWKECADVERARRYFDIVGELEPSCPHFADFSQQNAGKGEVTNGVSAEATPVEVEPESAEAPAPAPARVEDEHLPDEDIPDEIAAAMDEARAAEADGPDKAADAWRKVVHENPSLRAPRREYARVLREAERWNALVEALKDEESKAARSDGERVAILREMADVYRQVNNDVMVVNTLGRMLELRPDDLELLDTLAAQYEQMKRWPDLVATLNKKAPLIEDDAERAALYLRIANLYIDRFSNQAEAIKAFEQVLEIDPDDRQAIEHLLAVYEKRRDWEKLIALREREIDETEDPSERAEKVYEVAKLAAQRLKKPDICTHWWEKVLADDPGHEEAIGELEKLYERSKNWERLAHVCAVKANIASDTKTQTDALQKLGLLYTDKIEDPDKAVEAWRRLLDVDPAHRRAQDSLKKLYIAQGDWDELERFYRDAGKIDEFVRVLERQLDGADDDAKLALAMKIALLYRDEIGKADRAMRAFERVLTIDEENLEAAEALIPLYEQGRDPRKLVRALEIQLAKTEDTETRLERLRRLAEYSEERLRDKGAAFGYWLAAHREDHRSEEIREQVERLGAETDAWGEIARAYQDSYDKFEDRREALPLMAVVARVQERELGEIDAALETNRAILELDDAHEGAVDALERLYVGKGEFEELLDIYRRKLDLTTDPEARREILSKLGQLYEEEAKDDERAIETYQSILAEEGDDLTALRALDRIYVRGERWSDVAEILGRQLLVVTPDEATDDWIELEHRLARVREEHLSDVPGAIDAYRAILDVQPQHAGAREGLERRLDDEAHRLDAAAILEPIYEQVEDWNSLIRVHEIQVDASDDQLRRVDLLMRIGELWSKKLGDAERAFDAFARAFREDPATERAKSELEELSQLLDDGAPRLTELFEGALEHDLDPLLAHELSTVVARSYDERLGDTDKAVEYYRRALSIEPDDVGAIEALDRIFTRDEKYPELLDVYRKKVDISTEPEARLALLFRIASIHEEMLQNPDEAISTYNEILSHDGENVRALRALDRLYVQGEQWHELGDNLGRQLLLVDDDGAAERVELLVRLAQLRETQLGEVAAAVETYRQVLELEPSHAEAVQALERLIRDEDQELVIAQILEPIYKAAGAWDRQIAVYEIMAKHAFDPERKIELLHATAELHELGGDDASAAFETFGRAFREEPRNEATHAQLDRLARVLDRWRDVVGLYDEVIGEIADEELKVQLLSRLAQMFSLELQDDAAAVATYRRILETSPGHTDAASAIVAIHERNADYPALVAALVKKSEILIEVPERKSLLYRAAQIQEEILEDLDAAIATYQAVLDLDDIDMPAMDALERLYIRLERWEPLKDVYQVKADHAEDPDDKKRMLHVLGQVHDRELGDVAKAIDTYQAILDIDDTDLGAIQAVDRLYAQGERWYDLLGNLERQVELADMPGETVGLKYRIGQLWQHQLGDLSRSIESYREALEIDPQHLETLVALDGLLRSADGEPVMAARVLEPIYEMSMEFEKLIDVLEVMVEHAEDPLAKVDLLHRVAELYEHRLERHREAFGAYARALREDNGNELTLGHLERLADATSAWRELGELYSSEAEKSLDVPRQVELLGRLARVLEEELGDAEGAIRIYARILDVEFDNQPAVMALDRLYTASGQWQELADILRKEIQLADSDEEILSLQFRLGQVLEQSLRDLPAAIDVYREILGTAPDHGTTQNALEMLLAEGQYELEIAGILEPLYESAGEYEKLHRVYEVQLGKLSDPTDRQSMFQRLAELAEGQLYDQARAFSWWGAAVIEDPASELAVEEAERLAGEAALWHELVAVYVRVLERHDATDVRKQSLLRLARVHDAELQDAASAVETYLRVLEIDEKDPDALEALDRLYANAGMYDELVEILRRRIEITLDGDEIVELQLRRGQIYAEALADLDAALACYEQILEQETRNRPALEAEEQIFFRRQEWPRLHEVYEKLIDVAAGDDEMADLYARMARIASDALDDEDQSIDLWGRVLDIRNEDAMALSALVELYGRREMWEELVEVLERAVTATADDSQRIGLHKRLGLVWAEKLGREQSALEAWLRAYELDPNDAETLAALASLYRATQSWEELSQTLQRIIEVGQHAGTVTEEQLIELYAQLGQLEGELLGRVDEAVEAWRRVLALHGGDFRALNALEQLFTREARWEDCIEILERRAAVQEDAAAQIDTLLQAAAIWEEKVENLDRAAEVYERVRAADPASVMASERLEQIYRSQYNWEQLVGVLLERVEHAEERLERIETFEAVAKIYEQEIGDQELAFVVLKEAFREDYGREETARELERLATAADKWAELLQEYTQMVQQLESEDVGKAADLWVSIGRWYGDHLANLDWAIHSVQQSLRIDANHLGALAALADFQRKRGSWAELVETLGRHARVEPDAGRRVELYLSLADLFETQLQDPMQAIAAYQSALQADPEAMEALISLERLYRQHEMWEQLIDVLGRTAALRSEEAEIVRLKLEIGQLWDERLLDSGQAIQAYKEVLDLDPSSLPALRALEQLYEKTGESEAYLDVLEAQLDVSGSEAEQISLYERMASAWEERFRKLDRAAECLEKIVALDETNQAAFRDLVRLYRQEERWESLVDTYRRHIMATQDERARVDLYCAMGLVYEQELEDFDRAIEAYTDVLTFDPDEPRALDALGRNYERIEEWDRAIDVMSQLVGSTQEPAQQVDLYHRIGRILSQHLVQTDEAEQQFLYALTIDDAHVPTMEELVRLYSSRGDWLKAAQMMVRAESHTQNVLEKVRLLHEAARIYYDRLGQRDKAQEYFAAVLALDPEHVEAGEPLAELYFEAGAWDQLSPVLDMLVRKASQRDLDSQQLMELYYRTARCADELGQYERALEFYKAAYDLDSTHLRVLSGRADLLYKMQDWDGAGKIYQTILVQHRDSQDEAEVVRTYYRLGMVRQNLGERRKALNMFEKALEIDPTHQDTLNAVIAIQEAQGDWEAVIHAKRSLLQTANEDQQVELLDQIGAIYAERLANQQKSIGAYQEALEIRPNDHQLLQKLLDLYTETEQWKKTVETIERFIALEADLIRKGSYYLAAATICRDKLKALDEAIDYYDLALDNFFAEGSEAIPEQFLPRALKAFADIDKILTTKRDWKSQERAYRKMIKRLKPGDRILIDLWSALGEIYRTRLKSYQSAIAAFEVAQQLQPENQERREMLAELYILAGPDQSDKAVQQHMEMLKHEPFKYDSYKALRRIYMDTHQYDKTWCVCNTLSFLKKADEEEQQFYEQYKPRGFVKAKSRMTEEIWRQVVHPDENRYVGAIFAAIWQGAAMIRAQPHKSFGLKRKDRRQVESDQLQFSKIFYYTGQVLNVPMPDVYLQPEQQGEIAVANTHEKGVLIPSFVVRANLLSGRPEKEIAFAAARWLTFMRPDHYLKLALPTNTELKTAFLSAIVMAKPDFPVPNDMRALVAQYLPEMQKRTQPQWIEQLGLVVNRFLQNAPEINLAKWGNAVDATSHRAGFIIGGDLEAAAKMVSMEPVVVGGPQVKDKIKELVLYSISEDYFAVRHHLGTTIG